MDKLFCMQVFVRVVEVGVFARAADALDISRATASAAVAELEQRLGVRLLNRTTRRISLTNEGQTYYSRCVRLLGEIAEAEDDVSGRKVVPRGKLRVSVPHSFMEAVFHPALARFTQMHPQLEIEVLFNDRAVNLVEEGIDCAIRGVELPDDSGLVARVLSETHWLTCASPDYLARQGLPASPAELNPQNCIPMISQSTGRGRDWLFSIDGEASQVIPAGRVRLNSFNAVIQLAMAGGGVAQVPHLLAVKQVEEGSLVPILIECVAAAPSLLLVYPGNRYQTAKLRAFIDFFTGVFRKEDSWKRILRKSGLQHKIRRP